MMIKPTTRGDVPAIARIADATLFPEDMLAPMAEPALSGAADDIWMTAHQDNTPTGFCFCVREPFTEAAWNMKALAVDPATHRQGIGAALVAGAEERLLVLGGQVLVIDTASGPDQAAARAFYGARGYTQAGTIPSFWEDGTDKVTFWKDLRVQAR